MAICLQFNLNKSAYQFNVRLSFALLCLFTIMLCFFLAQWQMHRYHFKKDLLTHFEQQLKFPPQSVADLNNVTEFQRLKLQGTFSQTILLSNRFHQGKSGYEVLSVLNIPHEQKKILIDHGWSEHSRNFAALLHHTVELSGYVKFLQEYQFILGKNILKTDGVSILQKIDLNDLQQLTHQTFFPYLVRLDETSKFALPRDWVITSVEPERHLAYAVQWYALAFVLTFLFFYYSIQRVTH